MTMRCNDARDQGLAASDLGRRRGAPRDCGGCRCQAFALTGDARATDPVCHLAPYHDKVAALAGIQNDGAYAYRQM